MTSVPRGCIKIRGPPPEALRSREERGTTSHAASFEAAARRPHVAVKAFCFLRKEVPMDFKNYASTDEIVAMCQDPLVVRPPTSSEIVRAFEKPLILKANVIVLDGEYFLVGNLLCKVLQKKIRIVELAVVENDRGKRFIWPVRLSDASAVKALAAIRKDCCVVTWSKQKRRYSTQRADEQFTLGADPEESTDNLLLAGFGERTIDDQNDPRIAEILKTKSAA
jgi:hypothetical protein